MYDVRFDDNNEISTFVPRNRIVVIANIAENAAAFNSNREEEKKKTIVSNSKKSNSDTQDVLRNGKSNRVIDDFQKAGSKIITRKSNSQNDNDKKKSPGKKK